MQILTALLIIHISAGAVALLSGIGASVVKQFNWPHHWHQRFGKSFFYAMAVVFVSAVVLSSLSNNLFLFLIALFSFYFAHAGWRYAKNSTGKPRKEDWFGAGAMIVISTGMIVYGVTLYLNDDLSNAITLGVFGIVGLLNGTRDFRSLKNKDFSGKKRIALHVTMMLAGLISTVTAFVVTNFSMSPSYLLWIAPTIVITPYIIYWNRRLKAKSK